MLASVPNFYEKTASLGIVSPSNLLIPYREPASKYLYLSVRVGLSPQSINRENDYEQHLR